MRRTALAVTVTLSALSLAACAPPADPVAGPPPDHGAPPSPAPIGNSTVLDEQLLFSAEAAYNVAATAYLQADQAGALNPATKAQARAALLNAYEALRAARAAHRIGNAATFQAKANAAVDLARQARLLLPSSDPGG